jgi:hypothetical protein
MPHMSRIRLMKTRLFLLCCLVLMPAGIWAQGAKTPEKTKQGLLICLGFCQGSECTREAIARIAALRPAAQNNGVRLGVSAVFSHFQMSREALAQHLTRFLRLAEEFDLPVVVQFEGEYWRDARPDLWNWWDPQRPGFNPENRRNVEWDAWGPEHAIRVSWINWGRQLRIKPAMNLMSPRYRDALHAEMRVSIPQVLSWWRRLPADKKDLFVGIKVGHESGIGVTDTTTLTGTITRIGPRSRTRVGSWSSISVLDAGWRRSATRPCRPSDWRGREP